MAPSRHARRLKGEDILITALSPLETCPPIPHTHEDFDEPNLNSVETTANPGMFLPQSVSTTIFGSLPHCQLYLL